MFSVGTGCESNMGKLTSFDEHHFGGRIWVRNPLRKVKAMWYTLYIYVWANPIAGSWMIFFGCANTLLYGGSTVASALLCWFILLLITGLTEHHALFWFFNLLEHPITINLCSRMQIWFPLPPFPPIKQFSLFFGFNHHCLKTH